MSEGLERIAGIFRTAHEVDVDQGTRDVNPLLRLGPDVSVTDRVMVVMQRVEGVLRKNELTRGVVPTAAGKLGRGWLLPRRY